MRRTLVISQFATLLVACLALAIPSVGRAQARPEDGYDATQVPLNQTTPLGPGANVRFPDDPSLGPFLGSEGGLGQTDPNAPSQVTPKVLESMGLITETYDRARALLDLSREAILSNQLLLAHETLKQAMTVEVNEPNALRHDQLIIEAITITGSLTEALIRESRPQVSLLEPEEGLPEPLKKKLDPKQAIRLSRLEWQRAAYVAQQIINPTYRNEYLDRVVEGMGKDSADHQRVRAPERFDREPDRACKAGCEGPQGLRGVRRQLSCRSRAGRKSHRAPHLEEYSPGPDGDRGRRIGAI